VGLGTNNFGARMDAQQSERVVRQAVESGITLIESSNSYGNGLSEEYIGKAIQGIRDKLIVATKVSSAIGTGPNQRGTSRKHILTELDKALKRFGTDYIDLYQIHRPDTRTPVEEMMRTLDDLVHQGKVRYIGCSNFPAWQVAEAIFTSKMLNLESFISVQPEYSMLNRDAEKELIPFCRKYGLGVLPYYPLASGFLTGKYRRGEPLPAGTRLAGRPAAQNEQVLSDKNFDLLERLESYAAQRGHTMVELAIAWLLATPAMGSVIAGATKPEQVVANAKAADWQMTPEEKQEVDRILAGEVHPRD